jgi:hypothetical protein
MSKHLILFLAAGLFIAAGCDDSGNPSSSGGRDTIWVIDSSSIATRAPVSGRITLYNNCYPEASHGGVVVRLGGTNITTLTDDSGRYSFPAHQFSGRSAYVHFAKTGYYSDSSSVYYNRDSVKYFAGGSLWRLSNYSGKFIGEPRIFSQRTYQYEDTLFVDDSGVIRKQWYIIDSTDLYYYNFKAAALNEQDQLTSVAKMYLMVSRSPDIDPQDPNSYLFTVPDESGYPYEFGITYNQLEYFKIRKGDEFYVAVTAAEDCTKSGNMGLRRSEVIKMVAQ